MPTRKRNTKPKGILVYNKILKEFTRINDNLPEDRKLSIEERRKYVSEVIYPNYRGLSPNRVSKKIINEKIVEVLSRIPPKEGCDVNYISPALTADIGWFELNDYITNVLPNCIFIRVDAKEYGTTRIFNTRNYNYTSSGVAAITENLREVVDNNSALDVSFTGIKKLKKGKTNDGTPDNYFLDFILVINGEPSGDIQPVIYNLPREERKKATDVKSAIIERIKELKNKKKRRKNARKKAIQNLAKINKINQRQRRSTKPATKKKLSDEKERLYKSMQKQLEDSLRKGNITQEQFDKFAAELIVKVLDNRKDGGTI